MPLRDEQGNWVPAPIKPGPQDKGDMTLKREDRDWKLFVADFPADTFGDGFLAVRLHMKPGTWVKARQFPKSGDDAAYVTVEFGPHATLFLSHFQARRLHEELQFSAGVSEGFASAGPANPTQLAAPAEPTKETP